MTVPTTHQNKDVQAARKRRRRAPAGGAADDCFTCTKRGTKCDRRRPYCSQCLEVGNECSGYKTQLTWGVGVASRGKLRGLSLPVAKAPPVAPVNKKPAPRSRASSNATSRWSGSEGGSPKSHRSDVDIRASHHLPASVPTTPFGSFNEFPRYPPVVSTPPATQTNWANLPAYSAPLTHESFNFNKLNTPVSHYQVPSDSLSASVDSLSEVDYGMSPMAPSFHREEVPFMHSPSYMHESYNGHNSPVPHSPASAIMIDHQRAPTSCPSLVYTPSEPSSSIGSHHEFEAHVGHRFISDNDTLSVPDVEACSRSPRSTKGTFWGVSHVKREDGSHVLETTSSSAALSTEVRHDLLARMPMHMNYYENVICPSMVFIDGPDNPFRSHILHLASGSRCLQHAICALSACNLRMKRRLNRGQNISHSPLDDNGATDQNSRPHSDNDPLLSEEHQHRNLAVTLLNQQLNDPSKSSHDSVLATILLLCHYRMAESGIAKFHTQFAGVKKILGIRGSYPLQAEDSNWMEAIFTYFDSISASINEREPQLNHAFYGVPPEALLLPPGAENWVGCDRELFRIISKLGRLNLLSQNRLVQDSPKTPTMTRSAQPGLGTPLAQSSNQAGRGTGGLYKSPAQRFDGNGFTSQLGDDELFASNLCSSPDYEEYRSVFWREWKEARIALENWEFNSERVIGSMPSSITPSQVHELNTLSEAFRCAALLYTERLASPSVSSSQPGFRNLVSRVIYHATSLGAGSGAEKFLLWPLFVAGSECIDDVQRSIIRTKCRDIMTRSGYMNNLAALEILERLWAEPHQHQQDPLLRPGNLGTFGGPFNWTRCTGGPGVDIEWIMF